MERIKTKMELKYYMNITLIQHLYHKYDGCIHQCRMETKIKLSDHYPYLIDMGNKMKKIKL